MATDLSREDQALGRAAALIRDAHGELTKETSSLPGRVATQGDWEGGSADSFTFLMNEWQTQTTKILRTLEKFEGDLNVAESRYVTQDQDATDQLKKIMNEMNA